MSEVWRTRTCDIVRLLRGLPAGGVDGRKDVPDPAERAEADDPQRAGEEKMNQRREHAPLHELAEAGDEKTANGGNDVASGTLAGRHGRKFAEWVAERNAGSKVAATFLSQVQRAARSNAGR